MAIRRVGEKHVPYGPFKLGAWGLPINVFAISYSIILLVFMVLPPYKPVTATNMNYSGVIFGAVLIISLVIWLFYGRKVYKGPIKEVMEAMHLH